MFELELVLALEVGADEEPLLYMKFSKSKAENEHLAEQIDKRYTDRRILEKKPIPKESVDQIQEILKDFPERPVIIVTDAIHYFGNILRR